MLAKTRKPITEAERLEAILNYLCGEMARWIILRSATSENHIDKINTRILYLDEQIAITAARLIIENIHSKK